MRSAVFVLAVSAVMIAVGWFVSTEVMLLGLACLAGALILLVFDAARRRATDAKLILLDGSNFMYWRGGEPRIETVREVIDYLAARGYKVGVVFGANAGYRLEGRYRHHDALARRLYLPAERVMVVNKGEPADGMLLRVAQDMARGLSPMTGSATGPDQFAQVAEPSFLVSGRYDAEQLQLNLA